MEMEDEFVKRFRKAKTKNTIEAMRLCECGLAKKDEFYCKKSCCPFAFPDKENLVKGLYVCIKYELKAYILILEKSIKSLELKRGRPKKEQRGVKNEKPRKK